MKYLVLEDDCAKICTAENLRHEIDNGEGRMRIFRLCDLNDPKELFLRWFGNVWILVDTYGNIETGV